MHPSLELLQETIRYACCRSPYYRKRFSGIDLTIRDFSDLARFPILSRQDFVENTLEILVEGCIPAYTGITSGSTAANSANPLPLLHYHTQSEADVRRHIQDLYLAKLEHPRPLSLRIINANHGLEVGAGQPGCFALPFEEPYHIAILLKVLREHYSFPGFSSRIESLSAALNALKVLTLILIDRQIPATEFQIKTLTTFSWYLSSHWRSLLCDYWNVRINEVYGLSEVPGGYATRCFRCGQFHFSPFVIAEILAPDCNERVDQGVGRVVLTTFYPLADAQPLIRYDTADLVTLSLECPSARSLAFEFIGRRQDVVLARFGGRAEAILTPTQVSEILDARKDISLFENARARTLGLRQPLGRPKFKLSAQENYDITNILLEIEVSFSPALHVDRNANVLTEIRERILNETHFLRQQIEDGKITLTIVLCGPGTLKEVTLC